MLILVLLAGETRDYFEKSMGAMRLTGATQARSLELSRIENLEQLSLSGVWLLYSAVLMTAGIWRKLKGLRLISIVIFGITILKIFIYDHSSLETLYRIFSFIGLGVILLAVSYAYQRYKDIILGTSPAAGE